VRAGGRRGGKGSAKEQLEKWGKEERTLGVLKFSQIRLKDTRATGNRLSGE